MKTQAALVIFAKAPVAGQVKTRLIPDIGQARATSLYKELLSKTLDIVGEVSFVEKQLWISGDINHSYIAHLKTKHDLQLFQQKGNDLGERMSNAFASVLSSHSYTILIGSDCPSLLSSDLEAGIEYLKNEKDVVLGPAEDGGYYLIGLKEYKPELFSDINWGEETVFSETSFRIKKMNLNMGLLDKRADIDRVSDLNSYLELNKS
jgi:uncharacterized protein